MIILGAGSGGMKPSTPTIGTATAGDTTASVAFTASSYIGKGTITYTATSSPGGFTGTSSSSPITVSGLTNGTSYTFTVRGTTNYEVSSDNSAASNSVSPVAAASWESIATYTSTGAPSFSSIPQTYKHLQVRWYGRTNRPDPNGYLYYRFNGVSSAQYAALSLQVDTGVFYGGTGTYNGTEFGINSLGGNDAGSAWGQGYITILNYNQTNTYKHLITWSGDARGTNTGNNGDFGFIAGMWRNTSAITSIDFGFGYAVSALLSGSTFALYGMKG
jgi:hypothetical protein